MPNFKDTWDATADKKHSECGLEKSTKTQKRVGRKIQTTLREGDVICYLPSVYQLQRNGLTPIGRVSSTSIHSKNPFFDLGPLKTQKNVEPNVRRYTGQVRRFPVCLKRFKPITRIGGAAICRKYHKSSWNRNNHTPGNENTTRYQTMVREESLWRTRWKREAIFHVTVSETNFQIDFSIKNIAVNDRVAASFLLACVPYSYCNTSREGEKCLIFQNIRLSRSQECGLSHSQKSDGLHGREQPILSPNFRDSFHRASLWFQ